MKRYGIERQTLLVALIPILILAALLESYFIYSRFADLDSALLERSRMIVRQLATTSEYAVFSGNVTLLQQNIEATLSHQDVVSVTVLDSSSKPIVSGDNNRRNRRLSTLSNSNKSLSLFRNAGTVILSEPILPVQINLDEPDQESVSSVTFAQPLGSVMIEISKDRIVQQKLEILLFNLGAILLFLMITLLVALWAARRITRPIMEMGTAIRRVSEGKLDTRILPKTKVLELNELASGFNRMAQQLQQDMEILESRVAERTAALAASEHETRTLIENSPDFIARYDTDCRRTYANAAYDRMVAGGVAELLGKTPSESFGGANSEIFERKIKEVISSGNNAQFELKWPDKDGKDIYTHVRLTAERKLTGPISSILSVERDITELNDSRNELNRKEQAKSRFLAAAGHDLRQPLAATNLFIGALKLSKPSPEQAQIIQNLVQAMNTFNGLLDALLNISRLDAGIVKPEYSTINVVDLVNWLEQGFSPVAQAKQLGFKLYFPVSEPLFIRSDFDLLKSVMMNLVSNAIKYTAEGRVLVCFRRRGEQVLIQVWDTGLGMDKGQIEHIFDEFYQINNPQRDRTNGLGLGLAIAKRAITLLGESIKCRSLIGRGTVFEFKLSMDITASGAAKLENLADAQEEGANELSVRGKRFVVVEDDSLVAHAMTNLIEVMGGFVKCFHSAEDALNDHQIGQANYYIADYMLRGPINGIHFLNRLRQQMDKPINAVLVTGDTSPAFIREAEHCDWQVLYKPINITLLISAINAEAR